MRLKSNKMNKQLKLPLTNIKSKLSSSKNKIKYKIKSAHNRCYIFIQNTIFKEKK